MRTLVIGQNIYNGAESYAKLRNISLKDFVESIVMKTLLLEKTSKKRQSHSWHDERKDLGDDYKEAYAKYQIEKI